MSFWDIIWFIVVSFAFIAYLMMMFNILGDLVRDRSTSGGVKALWLLCLIVFPFLTAFVYLIVRGGAWRSGPAARRPQPIDTGMSHVGFRCAWDASLPERGSAVHASASKEPDPAYRG
jgi:hypothetical protein